MPLTDAHTHAHLAHTHALLSLQVKLETQSQRLQSTYNSVLTMQKHFIRQRRPGRPLVAVESTMREAPF